MPPVSLIGFLAITFVLSLAGASAGARSDLVDDVRVTIVVRVPETTPAGAVVHLAGDHASLGPWRADAHAMTRGDDGRWRTTLRLPAGRELAFKCTLGSWDRVEKAADGAERPNRTLVAADGLVVEFEVEAWADDRVPDARPTTIDGDVRLLRDVRSKNGDGSLAAPRRVWVRLPDAYVADEDRRFPVLYMFDGQNLFDRATSAFGHEWEADETARRLETANEIEPLIIVGIETTRNRTHELTPVRSERYEAGGGAAATLAFLVDELKPMIDARFRTRPGRADTAIGGSSLGGLVSLWIVERRSDVFGRCLAVSPALLFDGGVLPRRWAATGDALPFVADPARRVRFWIDVGGAERVRDMAPDAYVEAVRATADGLVAAGLRRDRDVRFLLAPGARHDEPAWAARLPDALRFLFPRAETPRADRSAAPSRDR